MAKNNTNGTETGVVLAPPTFTPTIHLILQGKGGVGKSIVASWLAEFFSLDVASRCDALMAIR
jgi:hypothetical protein